MLRLSLPKNGVDWNVIAKSGDRDGITIGLASYFVAGYSQQFEEKIEEF